MDKKKPAPTLPVSVEKQQQKQQARAAPPLQHIEVQLVNLWTFFTAIAVTISFCISGAYYMYVTHYPSQESRLLPRAATKVTVNVEDTQLAALGIGMLWCSTPQAAAGALAQLLPCHRWRIRRAAAYVALAFTVANHCMFAGAVLVIVRADAGHLFFAIVGNVGIFICAVGDLLGFLALLRFRGEEEEEEEEEIDLLGFLAFLCGRRD